MKVSYQKFAVATAIALATTAISAQFSSPARAAVLNYNFTVDSTWGAFDGNFSIDNSSLTGIGSESVQVTGGTFKFLRPWAYQGSDYAALGNNPGEWNLTGAVVQLLAGKFAGITASGYELASASGPITQKWSREMSWNLSGTSFQARWLNITDVPDNVGMNGGDSTIGSIAYDGPTAVVPEAVPEPISCGGLVLGAAGLAAARRKKKLASSANAQSETSVV